MAFLFAEPDPLSAKLCEALGEDPIGVLSINLALNAGSLAEVRIRRFLTKTELESLADECEMAGVTFVEMETTYTLAPKERETMT
jgi:hypothetical protein